MATAKHAYRGTMRALQELGLKKGGQIETVDQVATRLKKSKEAMPSPTIDTTDPVTLPTQGSSNRVILEVDPHTVGNWELHDRPENELGDIESLAKDLEENGQTQPCIVRPYKKDSAFDYELIVGERRWRAAKLRNIALKIIVEEINDHQAAIYQIAENGNRKDLSDYAKGMNYARLIELGIITQQGLEKVINKNKIEISRLLSFNDIPQQLWDAIGDKTKISARTAAEIRAIINKSTQHYSAVMQLAPRIGTGKLGAANLAKEVEKILSGDNRTHNTTTEIRTSSGRHLFTWRKDSNGNISISFPKDIRKHIDKNALEQALKREIESQISEIDKIIDGMVGKEGLSFHMETGEIVN
jgi:ParB family chromosome partitioning protein